MPFSFFSSSFFCRVQHGYRRNCAAIIGRSAKDILYTLEHRVLVLRCAFFGNDYRRRRDTCVAVGMCPRVIYIGKNSIHRHERPERQGMGTVQSLVNDTFANRSILHKPDSLGK